MKDKVRPLSSGHRDNLRRRFTTGGLSCFAPHEVLELLLTYAIPRRDVKTQAKILLGRFGDLRGVLDSPSEALLEIDGIGPMAATFLRLLREVTLLYLTQRTFFQNSNGLATRRLLRDYWLLKLQGEPNEVFEMAYLDGSERLLPAGIERLAEGVLDRLTVYPRQILKTVINRNCRAVIFCHNHPSGPALPSEHDERQTRALEISLRSIGVNLLDHFIVGDGRVYSILQSREI